MEPISTAILAKPALQLVNRLFKPLVDRLANEVSGQAQVAYHRLFGSYASYLSNAFDRHSYFNSIVFKNEQRRLKDFYLPLTLRRTRDQVEIRIDKYPSDEIDSTSRLLVVDTAGMGKTTLLKFLFLSCVEQEAGIPIFVELRKLSKKQSLQDMLLENLSSLQGKCKPDLFYRLMESGEFVFFLDGYDEIRETERTAVTSSIQTLIEKAPKNRFVLTSREEAGLVAFPSFQRYTVNALTKGEAYLLLRKYADAPLAQSLIDKLELPEHQGMHEFLKNPLLTSLLFKSFEYKNTIPLKPHIFYRQVYEALFEAHDLTKEGGEFSREKKCGLDVDRFDRVLRAFGAVTYRAGRSEFTKDEAVDYFGKAKTLAAENKLAPSSALHDATHAVPLLVVDGNYIRWSHRSIQEYFAAQYICKNTKGRQIEILSKYFNEDDPVKHANLILLCADIDRDSFDRSIGTLIARSLLTEYERSYGESYYGVSKADIDERRALTVGRRIFLLQHPVRPLAAKERENGSNISREIEELHRLMVSQSGESMSAGSVIRHGVPPIGMLHTKISRFVEIAEARAPMPFIVEDQSQIPVNRFRPKVVTREMVLAITDDPNNPANSSECFAAVTAEFTGIAKWKFDPIAARQFLDALESMATAKDALEPW